MSNQFALMRQRRFLPFFVTQFLGAFNDNFYKNALVVLLTFHAARYTSLSGGVLVNLCAGIFILPFFLFSATGGQIADKFEKSRLIRYIKLLELVIMGVAVAAFTLDSLVLMLSVLFLLGLQASLFGPVKYAILPQHLVQDELVGGNALVEAGTFIAILAGTICGGLLGDVEGGMLIMVAIGVVVAIAGYLTSRSIPVAEAACPQLRINWNPWQETLRTLSQTRRQYHAVFLAILGISWFWFYGALFLSQFPGLAGDVMGGDAHTVTLLLAMFSVGIGCGSLLCEKLSAGRIELGLVPFGSIGLTLFALDLWWVASHLPPVSGDVSTLTLLGHAATWRLLVDLVAIGIFGGFYIVPLYALMQSRSAADSRSRVIAANNIMNALFMVAAAALGAGLLAVHVSLTTLFLITAVLNAAVALYIYRLLPEFLLRFVAWLLVHTSYRVEQRGLNHLPEQGAALLVCNHVSFVDALVITAACRRPIRFVMDHRIFRWPVVGYLFRAMRCIPIAAAKDDPAVLDSAYDAIAEALNAGDLVAIFPEGQITRDGEMAPFRAGMQRIVARTPVPVIPLALSGLWGSFFSRKGGRAMSRPLRRGLFNRIGITAGEPWAPDAAEPEALQQQIESMRGAWR